MGWQKRYFKHSLYYVQVLDNCSGFTHIAIKRIDGRAPPGARGLKRRRNGILGR
jgi:hypothetical protein